MMIMIFYLADRNVGKRGRYADGDNDEGVDTRNMRQVEDMAEWPGSGSPLRGAEQEFVILWQVEADEQQAYGIDDGNTPEGVLDCAGRRWESSRRQDRQARCRQVRKRR